MPPGELDYLKHLNHLQSLVTYENLHRLLKRKIKAELKKLPKDKQPGIFLRFLAYAFKGLEQIERYRDRKRYEVTYHRKVRIRVDRRYPVEKYFKRCQEMIDNCPIFTDSLLRDIKVCYRYGDEATAQAYPSEKKMVFYMQKGMGERPMLRQFIFDHEMAHLAGNRGGGPPDRPLWREARKLDGENYHPELTKALKKTTISYARPGLWPEAIWVSRYAQDSAKKSGQVEDWAESVGYYLYSKRRGRLTYIEGKSVRFEDLFPHRAQVISNYIESLSKDQMPIDGRPKLKEVRWLTKENQKNQEKLAAGTPLEK